jgi:hypothetical protein
MRAGHVEPPQVPSAAHMRAGLAADSDEGATLAAWTTCSDSTSLAREVAAHDRLALAKVETTPVSLLALTSDSSFAGSWSSSR